MMSQRQREEWLTRLNRGKFKSLEGSPLACLTGMHKKLDNGIEIRGWRITTHKAPMAATAEQSGSAQYPHLDTHLPPT